MYIFTPLTKLDSDPLGFFDTVTSQKRLHFAIVFLKSFQTGESPFGVRMGPLFNIFGTLIDSEGEKRINPEYVLVALYM